MNKISKKILLLAGIAILMLFSGVFANESTIKLEIDNKVVLQNGGIISIGGVSYAEGFKISKELGLDFFSLNGGDVVALWHVEDGKETILYFDNIENKPVAEAPQMGVDANNSKAANIKKMSYLTTEMYDELEDMFRRETERRVRIEAVGEDTTREVEHFYYRSVEGETYLPIKKLSEALGYDVKYDERTNSVLVYTVDESTLPKRQVLRMNYTEEDLKLLAKICCVEAGDGSVYKQMAVCNVILNRVESPRFPDTISEVIYQRGQFPPAHRASFASLEPPAVAIEAAARALYGENNVPGALFFNMVPFPSKSADELCGIIEGEYFYY